MRLILSAILLTLLAAPASSAEVTGGKVVFHVDAKLKSADFVCPAVTASGRSVESKLTFDPAAPEKTAVSIKVNFFGCGSENESRDSNMLDTVEAYLTPYAEFTSRSVRVKSDTIDGDKRTLVLGVTGPFKVRGVASDITTDVTVKIDGSTAKATTAFTASLKNHKIKPPTLIGIKVADGIPVKVDLSFKLDGPGVPPPAPQPSPEPEPTDPGANPCAGGAPE